MTHSRAVGLLFCLSGLVACGGGGGVEIDPEREVAANRWNAILSTPNQLAGVVQIKGSGWMMGDQKDPGETMAFVSIANAVPGGEHPWHVHLGRCGVDRGIFGPAKNYRPLRVDGKGRAEAKAELPVPAPSAGEYFINVHASVNNMRTILACGNLAPPSR
jgi:hypothetical protein